MKYEELKSHPELSEAGRRFFSDYASDGPFYDYEKSLQYGVPSTDISTHSHLPQLTQNDVTFAIKNKREFPKSVLHGILAGHPNLSDESIDAVSSDPALLSKILQNTSLSNETVDKILSNPERFNSLGEDSLTQLLTKQDEKGNLVSRKGLSPTVLNASLNHPSDDIKSLALQTGEVPYETAKQFFTHPSRDVKKAAFSHPELPVEDLGQVLENYSDSFHSHPKAKEYLKLHPEAYNSSDFDFENLVDGQQKLGNEIGKDDVKHFLSNASEPNGRDLGKAFGLLSPEDLHEAIKAHPQHLMGDRRISRATQNENWTPEHTKTYWDKIKNQPIDKYGPLGENHPAFSEGTLSALTKKGHPELQKEIFDTALNSINRLNNDWRGVEDAPTEALDQAKHNIGKIAASAIDAHANNTSEDHPEVHEMLMRGLQHGEEDLPLSIVRFSTAFDKKSPEKGDTPFANLMRKMMDHSNPYIRDAGVDKIHPDEIESHIEHPDPGVRKKVGEKLEPLGIYPKERRVSTRFDSNKLRLARDLAEEMGGKVHKKELEKRGLNPQSLKISHLQDAKGEIKSEDIQKHIETLPKNDYGFTFGNWGGAQRHSNEESKVFQLQYTKDHIQKIKDEGLWDTFKYIVDQSHSGGHPTAEHNPLGWVRYTEDDGTPKETPKPKPKKELEQLELDSPGHPSHGRKVNVVGPLDHPQLGTPGFHVQFHDPIHMAEAPGQQELERPAGTAAWIGQDEIGENKKWKKVAKPPQPEAPAEPPKPKVPGVMIDEVQSDFGQALGRSAEAFARKKYGSYDEGRVKKFAEEFESKAPTEKREKISSILFGGRPSNEVLHESFLQHLRDKGLAGAKVAIWQLEPKMKLSGQSSDKAPPVHMKQGYEEQPKKMGYAPSTYSEENMPTQKAGGKQGDATWQHNLRKMEELRDRLRKLSKRTDL